MEEDNQIPTGEAYEQAIDAYNTVEEGSMDDPGAEDPNYNAIDNMLEGASPEALEDLAVQAEDPNLLSEAAGVVVGGAADAVESVGGFADLTGDTLKYAWNGLFGRPTDDGENPFSQNYNHGTWLDIPDEWVPENKTALGKLARGFTEFGLLMAATGGIGSATFGGAKLGVRGLAAARSAGVGARGTRYLKFLQKGTRIAAEGGAADLVSTASEDANLANLVHEFVPWMPFSEALKVNPDDNPWLARIKTVTAGAGVNLVGWRIASFMKGRWAAKQAYKAGKTIDEANDIGNQVDADEYIRLANESEEASTRTAAEAFADGHGLSHSDPRTEYIYKYLDDAEADRYSRADAGEALYEDALEIAEGTGRDFVPPDQLITSQDRYGRSNPIRFENDFDKAAWQLRGKRQKLAAKSNQLMESLRAQGFDINAVRRHGDKVHESIKAQVKGIKGTAKATPDNTLNLNLEVADQGFQGQITRRTRLDNNAEIQRLSDVADARGAEAGDVFDFEAPLQDITRKAHPKVNPELHLDVEKADLVPEKQGVTSVLRTSINDLKTGGTGRAWKHMWSQYAIKRMTGGSARRLKILERTRDELVEKAFKSKDNTMSYNDLLDLTNKHVADGLDILMDGQDIASRFKKLLTDDPHNYRVYMTDGVEIKTITPAQKAASQLLLAMLADTQSAIAQGAYQMMDDVPIGTQFEQIMDATKALMIEHKRAGVMWGLDGVAQQLDQVPGNLKRKIQQRIDEITVEQNQHYEEIGRLRSENRVTEMKKLAEMHAITGGKINTLEQLHDYLNKSMGWGRHNVNGIEIRGKREQNLLGAWYNSVLSSLKTPIKAIAGTNLITIMRPYSAWLGASLGGNKEEMVVAASMIDSMRKAFSEGMDMFWYNWDAGVHKQAQTYDIRYNLGEDMEEWQRIGEIISEIGTDSQKRAYGGVNMIAEMNSNPWMRYSTNAMGAGDALARTVIGRFEMRQRAIRKAIADGVDLDDARRVAQATEENFRKEIFKEGKDGKWVVHDQGAMMAGDEAAMTRNLEGVTKVFDDLNRVPILRAFFPFARTGVNALNLTFEHIPGLARTQRKFRDILSGDPEKLARWGIRPEDAGNARAMAEGRLAIGKGLMGMSALWTLTGNMTGDYPYDKEQRDLWKLNNIPPYSVKVGDTWVSYRNIEPFNTVASIAANLVTNSDILGESVLDEWIPKLGFMFSAVMVDKTMLSGVKELFAVADFESTNRGSQVARVLASKLRPIVPFAGLSRDFGNILDDVQKEKQSLAEMIIQRDAFFKSALPPQYDILSTDRSGKAWKRNHAFFGGAKGSLNVLLPIFNTISPIPIIPAEKIKLNGKYQEDPIKKTLQDMRYNLPEILSTYKGIRLNSLQRSRLQYYLSRSDLRKDLERLILPKNSIVKKGLAEYKAGGFRESQGFKLSHTPWYSAVHDIFRDHVNLAMELVLAEDAQLLNAVQQRERRIQATQTGDSGRMKYEQLLALPK